RRPLLRCVGAHRRRVDGEVDDDAAAAAGGALDLNRAAMQVDEGADDGEAETGAAVAAGEARIGPFGQGIREVLACGGAVVLDDEEQARAAARDRKADLAAGTREARG